MAIFAVPPTPSSLISALEGFRRAVLPQTMPGNAAVMPLYSAVTSYVPLAEGVNV